MSGSLVAEFMPTLITVIFVTSLGIMATIEACDWWLNR